MSSSLLLLLLLPLMTAAPAPCDSTPPSHARVFDSGYYDKLAGDYIIELVNSGGGWGTPQSSFQLHLFVTDSTYRARFAAPHPGQSPGPRPLAGWVMPASTGFTTDSYSQDVERPGAILSRTTLRLGGYDMIDGSGHDLEITHFAAEGFWGRWRIDLGIAVVMDSATRTAIAPPRGHFCARRIPA